MTTTYFGFKQHSIAVQIIGYVIACLVLLTPSLLLAQTVSAQEDVSKSSVKCGSGINGFEGGTPGNCNQISGEGTKVENLISTIINVISVIVGSVAVIMVIVGGFRYVTAGGDTNNVSGAKNTILYAIVGLVIVAFAQVLVKFVLQRSTENIGG